MAAETWLIFSVLILAIFFIGIAFLMKNKKKIPTDYYTLFIMGVMWVILGIIPGNFVFFIMGIVFMAISLKNKDKWKKNYRPWNKLNKKEKQLKLMVTIIAIAVLIAVITAFLLI